MAHLGAMLGYVGPSGRHLGATWRQDEAQERQDEPRWRTGAPRRGKIAELRRRGLSQGGGGFATTREVPACTPLRMDYPEWDSSMGLQTPTPTGNGSGKLEDWMIGYWGLRLYIVHATVPAARWRI